MSIITVSRESYSHGEEIANKVAEELGFQCVGSEIIEQAAKEASSVLLKGARASKKEIAQFRSAFYDHMNHDNVVYHGMAGHVFLADAPVCSRFAWLPILRTASANRFAVTELITTKP